MPRPKSVLVEAFVGEPEMVGTPSNGLSWEQRREWLRTCVGQGDLGINADEVEVHFSAMPAHYWEHVTEEELIWGLETVHGFLKLVASPEVPATAPFVSWRQVGLSGQVRVMLCTWDRHGLLAKAAAAFSAVRLNIVQAEVFTRSDNVVLDAFTITGGADGRSPVSPSQMEQMGFLLEGALSEPPRFASIWACSRHKYLAPATQIAPQISCDNDASPDSTLVHIEAADRLGLLYDILQAIADAGLNIKQARIETEGNLARDTIYVTDELGQKVIGKREREALCVKLDAALIVSP
jgi:[protein-PII] uridylyltransferase